MPKVFKPSLKTLSPIHTTILRVLTFDIQLTCEQRKGEPSFINEFQPVNLHEVVSPFKKRVKII